MTTIKSAQAVRCPDCHGLKVEFVLHADGARCLDCHISVNTVEPPRPLKVAKADWAAISLELHLSRSKP